MEDLKYCKLCLVTDVKMFTMSIPSILEAYSQLVQVDCGDYQMFICYECVSLLCKYQEFRLKCLTALNVLSSIHTDHSKITKDAVKNIDRKVNNLVSKLACYAITQCNITDDHTLPRDSSTINEKLFNDEMKSELNSELNKPNIKFEFDDLVPSSQEQNNIVEINIESIDSVHNDNDYADNDYGPEKKKKRKSVPSPKKNIKTTKTKNAVKQERNYSDCTDEPLANRSLKSKRKGNTTKSNNNRKKSGMVQEKESPKFDASCYKDYATVVVLTPEDAKKEVLLRKQSNNYKISPHRCDLCYRGFEFKAAFDNHMKKKHSPESGSLECESCHMRFLEKKFLYKHQFSSHKYKFICKLCPYVCYYTYQAKAHMNFHKGKKYPCEECGELFSLPKTLSKHRLTKHHAEGVCARCGHVFPSQQKLAAHTVSHVQDNTELVGPKCLECDVQFATETAWKRHLVLSSKHTVLNVCEYCGETFSDEKALKIHAKVHSKTRTIRKYCDLCGKWLKSRSEYKNHVTSQHPQSEAAKKIEADEEKKFVCEECGRAFKKKCFLRYHQRTHSNERPYECRQCGKTFRQPIVLYQHENTHTRQRVFQCDMCQKQYNTKNALVRHIKANHLGIRPYKCTYKSCGKSFLHEYEMKSHIKYVHYKVPWPKKDRNKRTANKEDSNVYLSIFK